MAKKLQGGGIIIFAKVKKYLFHSDWIINTQPYTLSI